MASRRPLGRQHEAADDLAVDGRTTAPQPSARMEPTARNDPHGYTSAPVTRRERSVRILVTGSAGHLGEALIRSFAGTDDIAIGLDVKASPHTSIVGSIIDPDVVRQAVAGADAVLHTATLHKPHVATHSHQAFVDTNVTGTLNLLEKAAAARVGAFVFTSTTSAFGDALTPPKPGAPAVWVDESLPSRPKNIYGATKTAAEDLCQLFARNHDLPCVVLRTSRFFPEHDDDRSRRERFDDANLKANELLCRRADLADIVSAHRLAIGYAPGIGFDRFVVSAPTPFTRQDLAELVVDAPAVVRRRVPNYEDMYAALGWRMFPSIDRVYDSRRALERLGWTPRHDFGAALQELRDTGRFGSDLARSVGIKGYHDAEFEGGPYPVAGDRGPADA